MTASREIPVDPCRHRPPGRTWIPAVSVAVQEERDVHVLLWQVHGEALIVVEDEPRTLRIGHALWIPVGTRHEFTVQANSVTVPLFFVAAELATTLREPTEIRVDHDLRTLMLAMNVSYHSIIQPQVDLARQILSLIEDRPAQTSTLPMPSSGPARRVAEMLRVNPGDSRTVEELAAGVHTSSRTLERAFREETAMTLRQWRIRTRMEAAETLLRAETTVDAVAHRIGYTNVNAFRRVFTAHVGISPSRYAGRYGAQS